MFKEIFSAIYDRFTVIQNCSHAQTARWWYFESRLSSIIVCDCCTLDESPTCEIRPNSKMRRAAFLLMCICLHRQMHHVTHQSLTSMWLYRSYCILLVNLHTPYQTLLLLSNNILCISLVQVEKRNSCKQIFCTCCRPVMYVFIYLFTV